MLIDHNDLGISLAGSGGIEVSAGTRKMAGNTVAVGAIFMIYISFHAVYILLLMSHKRNAIWDELEAKMMGKRTKNDAMNKRNKKGSAPHKIVVQKLSSEADRTVNRRTGQYDQDNLFPSSTKN